ncbi:Ig-like domain-containing protein [Leptospira alstonii]|uniref:Ig-like domain-containing protein n=1 Tax=Leptospira alstonii TaxID=28452 RepID=UPI000AB47C11|nr:Ig-like domain-containing protein [Leptospira alstonii]
MNAYAKILISFSILIFGSIGCVQGKGNSSIPFLAYLDFGDSKMASSTFSVSQISPGPNVTGVSLNTSVQVGFSQKLDSSSIQSQSIQITQGNAVIPGTITSDEKTILFKPTSPLAASKVYTVRVSKDIKSAEGSSLSEETVWNFTTATIVDLVAPALSLGAPSVGNTLVPNNTSIQVAFTEAMDCTTVDNTTFTLKNNVTNILEPANVNCLGSSATLNPTGGPLTANTVYRVDIAATMKDLAGNALLAPQSWTFTTGAGLDVTPPTVPFVSPAAGTQGTSINTAVSVAFNEPVNCGTIAGNFTLDANPLLPVVGDVTVTVNCSGTTASITPTGPLAFNTTYTANISNAVTDLSGNPVATTTWTFTTGAAPDTTQPTVTFTVPAANDVGIGTNVSPTVAFSEPMSCASVTSASFRVKRKVAGTYLTGNVNCFGTSATWTLDPLVNPTLTFNTAYTVEINAGALDSANNPAVPYSWDFTTGPGPDITPPSVVLVTPANGALGVAVNGGVSIAFDETMNCGTVLGGITLDDDPLTPATVVPVNINCNGNTTSFAPAAPPLAFNTTYTVKIANTVTDSNNNPIGAYSWSFTTGAAPDVTPPQISLVNPLAAATGVPTNANITVSFSETIDCSTLNFTVNNGIGGIVNCSGASATFVPNVGTPLNAGTTYTATIGATVKDLNGNSLLGAPAPYNWTFTTGLAPDVTPPTITIQNARNNTVIESGFIIGTAADDRSVASVEVSVDGGGFTNAGVTGTTSWKYQLPTGGATWLPYSQHTIKVKAIDASGNVTTGALQPTVSVRKGTNKDINGDGYVDLVTSEYGQGIVYLFYSSGTAGITITNATAASRIIVGVKADFFGKTVASGDFNGDGFADIAVGAPNTGNGKVYIFHSAGTQGINTSFYGFANTILTGNTASEQFGASLATGDMSGDGYTDLVVGAPGYSTAKGRIYVFHSQGGTGIATAAVTVNAVLGTCTAGCNYFKVGANNNDQFGFSIAVGNINGGNFDDIAVAAPGNNGGAVANNGRIYIYYGTGANLAGPNTITNTSAAAPGASAMLGYAIALGDFNNDGYIDLVAGAPMFNANAGRVEFYTSSGVGGIGDNTLGNGARMITGSTVAPDVIGSQLTARDLDLDGNADIIIGAASNPSIFITSLPLNAALNFTDKTYNIIGGGGVVSMINGPGKLISTGDINGDGSPDLIISTPGETHIYHLTNTGVPVSGMPTPSAATSTSSTILGSLLTGGIGGQPGTSNEFGAALY